MLFEISRCLSACNAQAGLRLGSSFDTRLSEKADEISLPDKN